MILELASGWFRLELEKFETYVRQGRARIAEINTQAWRVRGKRGPTHPPIPTPAGIGALAKDALHFASGPDCDLLMRAARGDTLRMCDLRRVEYLALKLTSVATASDKTHGSVEVHQ